MCANRISTLPDTQIAAARAQPMPELVSRRVALKRSGDHLLGRCPFHTERSASFHVYQDHAHCFGCGWHGNAISFLMRIEKFSFPAAVERLAPGIITMEGRKSPLSAESSRGPVTPRRIGRLLPTMGLCSDEGWAHALASRYSLGMYWVDRPELMARCIVECERVVVFALFDDDDAPALAALDWLESRGVAATLERLGVTWQKSRSSRTGE